MPAYNAEKTLAKTLNDIPRDCVDEIILVDDCSSDGTVSLARELGLVVLTHEKNLGYGANQKTCYDEALKRDADIVVMLHPDYQYDGRLIPYMKGFIEKDICDVIHKTFCKTFCVLPGHHFADFTILFSRDHFYAPFRSFTTSGGEIL